MAIEHAIVRNKNTGNILSQYTDWQDINGAPNLVTQEELLGKNVTWAGVDMNPKLKYGSTMYKEVNGVVYLFSHFRLAETPSQPVLFHVPILAGKQPGMMLWTEYHMKDGDAQQGWDRTVKLNPDGSIEQWNLQDDCEVAFNAAIPMNFN